VIFIHRTRGVGVIDRDTALRFGCTGPVLRASGVPYDIRRAEPYSVYPRFEFDIPTGTTGDVLARYTVRLQEMEQSLHIVEQALDGLPEGPSKGRAPRKVRPPARRLLFRRRVGPRRPGLLHRQRRHHLSLPAQGASALLRQPAGADRGPAREPWWPTRSPSWAASTSWCRKWTGKGAGEMWQTAVDILGPDLASILAGAIGLVALVQINTLFLVWLERKVSAHIQLRLGPMEVGPHGILQSLVDGVKLLGKELITPRHVDRKLYVLAPIVVFTGVLACLVVIPFDEELQLRDLNVGVLLIFAFSAFNVLAILMGGWSANNKYSLLGAIRSVAQNVAYEIPLLLVVLNVLLWTNSMQMSTIVAAQSTLWNVFWMPVAAVIYLICATAETNRAPFDIPEAESELVAGFHTEYSGMRFAMFFLAEYSNMFIVTAVATTLFFGGWKSPPLLGFLPVPGVVWFFLKVYALIFVIIWVRWTFPRLRFDQLMNFSWKVMIPVSLVHLDRLRRDHQDHPLTPESSAGRLNRRPPGARGREQGFRDGTGWGGYSRQLEPHHRDGGHHPALRPAQRDRPVPAKAPGDEPRLPGAYRVRALRGERQPPLRGLRHLRALLSDPRDQGPGRETAGPRLQARGALLHRFFPLQPLRAVRGQLPHPHPEILDRVRNGPCLPLGRGGRPDAAAGGIRMTPLQELVDPTLLAQTAFAVLVVFTFTGALIAVLPRNILYNVLGLILCLTGVAGLFLYLGSPFIALMELLIYVGAICISIVFAIMLSRPLHLSLPKRHLPKVLGAGAVALAVFGVLAIIIFRTPWHPAFVRGNDWSISSIGAYMLTRYSLVFEVMSVVLLVAILGAILITGTGGRRAP
jgi:NADH-quinone oxidoreductase subunit H